MCACYDLEMLNGCNRMDEEGNFFHLSDIGYSVVGYVLLSSCFSDFVERLIVTAKTESDHMPVQMFFKHQMDIEEKKKVNNLTIW